MKKKILVSLVAGIVLFSLIGAAEALLIVDQTGNLIANGSFEAGVFSEWRRNGDGMYWRYKALNYPFERYFNLLNLTTNRSTL